MGFELLRNFSLTLFISGESVLPVSGLYLPPAQPQNAAALPAGEDGDCKPNRTLGVLLPAKRQIHSVSRLLGIELIVLVVIIDNHQELGFAFLHSKKMCKE